MSTSEEKPKRHHVLGKREPLKSESSGNEGSSSTAPATYRPKIEDYGPNVKAIQVSEETADAIEAWLGATSARVEEIDPFDETKRFPGFNIRTLTGVRRASRTDWVVSPPAGYFAVLKDHEFNHLYEPISEG